MVVYILLDIAIILGAVCLLFLLNDYRIATIWIGFSAIVISTLALAYGLTAAEISQSMNDNQRQQQNNETADAKNNSATDGLTAANLDNPNERQQPKSEQGETTGDKEHNVGHIPPSNSKIDALALLTGVLVVCNIVALAFQFWYVSIAKQNAQAATKAANATLDYAKITDEMMHRQLRAYECVVNETHGPMDVGQKVKITVSTKNCGQTPAYDARAVVSSRFISSDFSGAVRISFSRDAISSSVDPPGKEQFSSCETEQTMSPELFEQFRNGKQLLWVYGRITYRDIFNKRFLCEFRFFMRGVNGRVPDEFLISPTGNFERPLKDDETPEKEEMWIINIEPPKLP